ncbi:Diadenosine polyphosphate hydrolase and related proteins of the histidine triad (HIT) family [Ceraceosorus bombacis]|uniref:Diadenosine polyphosphate hydrolase and related proteins of the histidine triad (HIT) family n=1 Tax=Ceraceosorus bombacis TaxID=401625 RepID=A0A0P1BAD2_9BASI|nr:Diadenosine polyphosphate hydrolase and related proteins of the histidine triad (HIT) family [Ceraceosorus bombacis]
MSSAAQPTQGQGQVKFGPFDVSTQVFARNEVAVALVNIKPIVPGHVLIYTHLEAFGMSLFKRQKSLLEPAGVKAEVEESQAKQSERGLDASSPRTERSLEQMQKEARWLERKWNEGDWNREK